MLLIIHPSFAKINLSVFSIGCVWLLLVLTVTMPDTLGDMIFATDVLHVVVNCLLPYIGEVFILFTEPVSYLATRQIRMRVQTLMYKILIRVQFMVIITTIALAVHKLALTHRLIFTNGVTVNSQTTSYLRFV